MKKKSCVIYDSWADQIISLPTDMAGEYAQKLLMYAIYGEEVKFDNPALEAMFVPVKKRLDEDFDKYQAQIDRMNKNRQKSNRSQTDISMKSDRSQREVMSVNDNDNVNVNVKKNKRKNAFCNFPERTYDYEKVLKGNV